MTLKAKFRTQFPASILVQSPILLDKTGAVYTFSIDVTALQATFSNLFQPVDDTLTALAALNSTAGLLVQTGIDAFTKRTLTGTANEITVTNGDGVAGAPTLSLPTSMTFTSKTITGGTYSGAVSYNKVVITAPATSATLTLIDGTTLTGPAASGTVMTLGNVETVTGAKTFNDGKMILAGSSSGTTTLKATAAASGTITLPAATDTLVGKATTDTLTNKTLDSAGTGNVLKVSGVTVSAGQYPGTTTNDNATAGNVGEPITSTIASGSAVSLTSGTIANVTSISLTAGDWDVRGFVQFLGGATTTVAKLVGSVSATTATLDQSPDRVGTLFMSATTSAVFAGLGVSPVTTGLGGAVANTRFSLASTTTVFLVAVANFGTSTCSAYGTITARRVR